MSSSQVLGYVSNTVAAPVITQQAATKRTILALSNVNTNNATTTIGTVGAGKVWRVIYAEITGTIGNAVLDNQILFNDVAMVTMRTTGLAAALVQGKGVFQGSYENAIVLTAGQTIKTVVGASGYGHYNVYYIEEAA